MHQHKNKFFKLRSLFGIVPLLYVVVFLMLVFLLYTNKDKLGIENTLRVTENHFDNLNLKAKAVYVYDMQENKVLYEKNSNTPLPLASITKLMSIHCALKKLNLNDEIVVPDKVYSYNDMATSTGATEVWTVKDLAIYTLITSSNTGATVLSDYAGGEDETLGCMNKEAEKMNLFETSFKNVTGLDINNTTPGSKGSAENVGSMFQNIYFADSDVLSKTSFESYNIHSKNGTIHKAQNTNIVANKIVGFLGSKTGLTDIAGGNITYAMNVGLNHMVFVAILGSTGEGRFEDALTLNKAILKSFSN